MKRLPVLDRAVKLLAVRSRTEEELRRALSRAGYPEEERESAVARLRELGYLNDVDVARARARSLLDRGAAAGLSQRRLEEQGIRPPDAAAAVGEAAEGSTDEDRVRRALDRRLRGRASMDEAEKVRTFRALVRKGHRPTLVARALGIGWDGDDDV